MKTITFNDTNHYFLADCHVGHGNIMKYCRRDQFLSDEEISLLNQADRGEISGSDIVISKESIDKMDNTIFDNINAVVGKDDFLWLLGDFCFSKRGRTKEAIEHYRSRIKCRKIRFIWGNHDPEKDIRDVFLKYDSSFESYEQIMLNIQGQKIFLNHYPMRSWDCAYHGCWDLYGHVHNLFYNEDNGQLPDFQRKNLNLRFGSIFDELGININDEDKARLLDVIADELYGINMTLDVGVDRESRFSPWSFTELKKYFAERSVKWMMRKELLSQSRHELKSVPKI